MDESTSELMSRDEECCLKTALAFAVLRKRLEQNDNDAAPAAYLGGLMQNTIIPSMPSTTTSHLSKMLKIAISTATPLLCGSTTMDDAKRASALQTLEGMAQHLGLQLRSTTNVSMEWLQETLSDKHDIVAVSLVWHLILQAEPSVGKILLPAICQVLQHLYHSTTNADAALSMVKLLELAEASVSIRLSTTSSVLLLQELSQAAGPELCLPIAKHDLAYFVLQSNHGRSHAGNKILLRFCLYDLMEKLSAYKNNNHEQ
jgi:hypothetical protein